MSVCREGLTVPCTVTEDVEDVGAESKDSNSGEKGSHNDDQADIQTLSWHWGKKMRRIREEMDETLLWSSERKSNAGGGTLSSSSSTQWVPTALNQSEGFSLKLTNFVQASTGLYRTGKCSEDELEAAGGLFEVIMRVMQAGEISDSHIKEICSLLFGWVISCGLPFHLFLMLLFLLHIGS